MSLPYAVHPHAKDRIIQRWGVHKDHVKNWVNQALANSVKAYVQEDGRTVYQHKTKEVFLVVSEKDMLVITTIDKPIQRVRVSSPFLDAMAPQLERELFKMKRAFTRQRRQLEKTHAETITQRGKTLERRAAAKNPLIQSNLAREAKAIEVQVRELEATMDKLKLDFEISFAKVNVFLGSIGAEKVAE